ncbi:MAG: transporter substrate-binding domain-containing protein [Bacilli bacterium]|nr:transporter substrate-binding domain-containing protein [Bacilli bacterium]
MKKFFIFSMMLLLVLLVGCQDEERVFDIAREDQFIVGMEANYQPFNWTEDFRSPYNHPLNNFEGKYVDGYDVQIAKAIAASLGKVLIIEKLEWDALIPSLEAKRIDAIIAGMSPTEERKASVSFSEAYYESKHVVLVMAEGEYTTATTLNDFSNARIVGQQGTIYDKLVPQLIGAIHGTALKTVPDILTGMLGGKIDGTILELPVALGIVSSNPEFTYCELDPGFNVTVEEAVVSVAVRLEEEELVNTINNILAAISLEVRTGLMEDAVERSE